ncbi:hypothetical protein CY35_03G012300 [Sphagnum magellanicum]|nr:hypothetical protein CY35_03G012300 [Sphagnum magellanicum]
MSRTCFRDFWILLLSNSQWATLLCLRGLRQTNKSIKLHTMIIGTDAYFCQNFRIANHCEKISLKSTSSILMLSFMCVL